MFSLLETILWQPTPRPDPSAGYTLLDEHLTRLLTSAAHFGFAGDRPSTLTALTTALTTQAHQLSQTPTDHKVRLLLHADGHIQLEATPWVLPPSLSPLRIKLAPDPIDRRNELLYHKTTERSLYTQARAAVNDCDDVLLWNDRREVTETSIANLVLPWEGRWLTPPVHCGLLPGTLRAHLLATGQLEEAVISLDQLCHVPEFYLINSLRQWQRAILVD